MKVFIKGLDITHGKDTIKLEELNVEVNYKELLECIQELGVLNLDNSEQVEQMQDINSKMEDLVEAIKTDDFSKII
tara:strand:+ start:109 stop:336 length:228 start_codon:yes stop_codon:yes gene_type:complete